MDQPRHQMLEELRDPTKALRRSIPDTWGGFVATHEAPMAHGAVPARIEEATALAISVAQRCDGCIAYHAKAAALAGASPDEVSELLGVAFLMGGGTPSVYGPRVWAAFHEFCEDDTSVEAVG